MLKPEHPSFNRSLSDFLNDLKGKVLFIYSDAHLDDLRKSEKSFRDTDLKLMDTYVNDNQFSRDPIKKKFECRLATPFDAFYAMDNEAYDNIIANPFDIDSLFKDLDGPEGELLRETFNSIMSTPINLYGVNFDKTKVGDEEKRILNKMIPGYSANMTLRDVMHGIMPYASSLLQDSKEVSELRNYMASRLDSNEFSFEKWGMEFDKRFRHTNVGKTFSEVIEQMLPENQKNDFFMKFQYTYSFLEMFNVTKERAGNKTKKFNYSSLTTDANHAYYASLCDYLVTDDKGLQVKAHIIFNMFGIKTKILSSMDFLNMRTLLMHQEETYTTFAASIEHDFKHALILTQAQEINPESIVTTYQTTHSYLNYFNRLQSIKYSDYTTYILFNYSQRHQQLLMYREIELVVNKLVELLGPDDLRKVSFDFEKEGRNDGVLRTWTISRLKYQCGVGRQGSRSIVYLQFALIA
jgi:hypothetical protein